MAATPDPWRTLTGEFKKLKEEVRRLRNSSPFFGTGVHPNGDNGLDLDGTLNVDGEIVARGGVARSGNYEAGTAGWVVRANGTAEFKDVTLYDIPNSMLANPVAPATVWQEAADFTVSPAWANIISATVTVPAGFTKASISAKGRITAFYNQGTGTDVDYLYAHLYIGSASSDFYPTAVTGGGGSGTSQVFRDVVLTGLTPGDTVAFVLQASTDYATWSAPSSPGNKAKLGASINWYR